MWKRQTSERLENCPRNRNSFCTATGYALAHLTLPKCWAQCFCSPAPRLLPPSQEQETCSVHLSIFSPPPLYTVSLDVVKYAHKGENVKQKQKQSHTFKNIFPLKSFFFFSPTIFIRITPFQHGSNPYCRSVHLDSRLTVFLFVWMCSILYNRLVCSPLGNVKGCKSIRQLFN